MTNEVFELAESNLPVLVGSTSPRFPFRKLTIAKPENRNALFGNLEVEIQRYIMAHVKT